VKTFAPTEELARQLASLPDSPGVYIFKDATEEIIYIGKALSLRSRVRSYWNVSSSWAERPKLAVMMPKVASIETILTNSEKEALLVEATLVRQQMPRYNVYLKDDKRYPWLTIAYDEPFPRLIMVRDPAKYRKEHSKARVFGPYVETGMMWETVRVLRKVFPMRQRRTPLFKDRPCMNFSIGLCLGPCQKLVEEGTYNKMVQQVELFLSGRQSEVIAQMKKEMEEAANELEFERAAKIRNRIYALETVIEKQQVFFQDNNVSQDVLAEAHTDKFICISLLRIREGKLVSSESFTLPLVERTEPMEAFQSFVDQYYTACEDINVPREVIVQHELEDMKPLTELLAQKARRQVKLHTPRRGGKTELVEMAEKNALQALQKQVSDQEQADAHTLALLTRLQEDLRINRLPKRIECFDISNIQGTDNVASMVVFENALSKKSDYRTFKIRSVEGQANDFASMKEVVCRRYRRIVEDQKPMPDLIIIDGGKGQLNAAMEALNELGVEDQPIIGLAKKQEEVYFPGRSDPALLPRRAEALHLLQRIRDEAHRFAVTFHRKLRAKRSLKSQIDDLPGIGKARRKTLLDHFGSFDTLKNAPLEDLLAVPGLPKNVARSIWGKLHPSAAGTDPIQDPQQTQESQEVQETQNSEPAENPATII
jgi:excinuclease ABC subunit C